MSRRTQVRIENPVVGGQESTSLERACRFVRKGRAIFTGEQSIRFVDGEMQQAIRRQAEMKLHAALTGAGYDRVGRIMGAAELRHVPVIHPEKLLHGRQNMARRMRPASD
jgi:hypothetical protein